MREVRKVTAALLDCRVYPGCLVLQETQGQEESMGRVDKEDFQGLLDLLVKKGIQVCLEQ